MASAIALIVFRREKPWLTIRLSASCVLSMDKIHNNLLIERRIIVSHYLVLPLNNPLTLSERSLYECSAVTSLYWLSQSRERRLIFEVSPYLVVPPTLDATGIRKNVTEKSNRRLLALWYTTRIISVYVSNEIYVQFQRPWWNENKSFIHNISASWLNSGLRSYDTVKSSFKVEPIPIELTSSSVTRDIVSFLSQYLLMSIKDEVKNSSLTVIKIKETMHVPI